MAKKKKRDEHKKLGLKAYRRRQYVEAVSHLEKALKRRKNDPEIYLFLGYASLFTGDQDGARAYFKGGLTVDDTNAHLLKGLAYVYLQDERVEDAISLWGEVLEYHPGDKSVSRALQKLRGSENINEYIGSLDVRSHLSARVPVMLRMKPYFLGISITAGALIVFSVFYFTPLYEKTLQAFYPELVELNQLDLPRNHELLQEESESARYSYSGEEIRNRFEMVKKLIYRDQINAATIALNRVMLSNAAPLVKERFEILYTFIDPPDPLNIDYVPRLYEILREPAAYSGVYVLWKGKIANLQKDEKLYTFDLLVNYENQDTIEGIAHVTLNGTYHVENRQNVEVFGAIAGVDQELGAPIVDGILLRDLGM